MMQHECELPASASVVLPVAADVPARFAVPVQVRTADLKLARWIPADGRYHAVPIGTITFLATLPDGEVMQTSAEMSSGSRVRIMLPLAGARRKAVEAPRPTLLDQRQTALRFLAQSSLDSYRRTRKPSLASSAVAAADELRLGLASRAVGVQFLELLSPGAFPMFVAYSGSATLKLVRLERHLAADVAVMDQRVELALKYLHEHRGREAATLLELQHITLAKATQSSDVATTLGCLHILLTAGRLEGLEETAAGLASKHPDVADFAIIAAECAHARNDHEVALARLTTLQESGLPLLYRSYVLAAVRLAAYAARRFCVSTHESSSLGAASAVHERLQALAPHVDPSSVLLVVRTGKLDAPSFTSSLWQRWTQFLSRQASSYFVSIDQSSTRTSKKGREMSESTKASSQPDAAAMQTNLGYAAGRATAILVIGLWAVAAVYLLTMTGTSEVTWSRLAWVFSSIEAVAFGAAGLLFGVTINRQRAERAEARADANQKDAERGRSLAAALKAEEPDVVHESAMILPGQSRDMDQASQIAARHARLARQLFP